MNDAEENEHSNLFMALNKAENSAVSVWFVDSGCSNHMTGMKSLFNELNEAYKLKVTLGDNKELQVEGKGSVGTKTLQGNG